MDEAYVNNFPTVVSAVESKPAMWQVDAKPPAASAGGDNENSVTTRSFFSTFLTEAMAAGIQAEENVDSAFAFVEDDN